MFICPYSIERREKDFIICKLMSEGKNIQNIKIAVSCMCAHQRYCNCKKKAINSNGAEDCYNAHKN